MGMKFSVCTVDRPLPMATPFPLRGTSYEECAAVAEKLVTTGSSCRSRIPPSMIPGSSGPPWSATALAAPPSPPALPISTRA